MVLVFFVTYIVFQPLATAIIRKIGPRTFISTIVMTWGACLIVRSHCIRVNCANCIVGICILARLADAGWVARASGCLGGWFLSRLGVSSVVLVFAMLVDTFPNCRVRAS